MRQETGTTAARGDGNAGQPSATDKDMGPSGRRLLAATPLHAITALHGEAGLRERFAIEIASFPDADRQRIKRALDRAATLHAADRRQREPYVNHYADLGIMPTWRREPLVGAVLAAWRSA